MHGWPTSILVSQGLHQDRLSYGEFEEVTSRGDILCRTSHRRIAGSGDKEEILPIFDLQAANMSVVGAIEGVSESEDARQQL